MTQEMLSPATTHDEELAFVRAGGNDLFMVLTRPTTTANGFTIVLLQGGGQTPCFHRNRMWVRLARHLSNLGFHVVRFDYHGVGESSGVVRDVSLDHPFVEDLRAVTDWLAKRGLTDLILVGNCFGARTAVALAASLSGMRGLVIMTMPWRDYAKGDRLASQFAAQPLTGLARRALRPGVLTGLAYQQRRRGYLRIVQLKWARTMRLARTGGGREAKASPITSPALSSALRAVLGRGVPVLFVYGESDDHYADLTRVWSTELADVARNPLVRLKTLPGDLSGYSSLAAQDRVSAIVSNFACRRTQSLVDHGPA